MKNCSRLGPTHQLTIHSFKQFGISSEGSLDSIQFSLFIQQISFNRQFTKIKTQYYITNISYINMKAQKTLKRLKTSKKRNYLVHFKKKTSGLCGGQIQIAGAK